MVNSLIPVLTPPRIQFLRSPIHLLSRPVIHSLSSADANTRSYQIVIRLAAAVAADAVAAIYSTQAVVPPPSIHPPPTPQEAISSDAHATDVGRKAHDIVLSQPYEVL